LKTKHNLIINEFHEKQKAEQEKYQTEVDKQKALIQLDRKLNKDKYKEKILTQFYKNNFNRDVNPINEKSAGNEPAPEKKL